MVNYANIIQSSDITNFILHIFILLSAFYHSHHANKSVFNDFVCRSSLGYGSDYKRINERSELNEATIL